MREDFEIWWEKEGQYSELCGKELCSIAWSNGEYKAFKELTDDEIWKLWVKHLNDDIIVFARAILKKAMHQ